MKIGIVFKDENDKARAVADEIGKYIENSGNEAVLGSDVGDCDSLISIGGDGTLIHKACQFLELEKPIFGINTGNLGFLSAVDQKDWKELVDAIIAQKVYVSERICLEIRAGEESFRAVNEAAIKGLYRVVDLAVSVTGEEFLKISGDGVIVSTQTGSTAYSLSAGGPIVDSSLDCILVTPINPIGLPIPSVVLSPVIAVEVGIEKGSDVSLIIDGQEHKKIKEGDKVQVKKGDYKVRLGYISEAQFIRSLKTKFGLHSRLNI